MLTKLRTTRFSSLLLALFIAANVVRTVQAQSPDSLVLNVTVTNEEGVLSRGLSLENFSITVDKQPQKIVSLSDREVPASIGILIDDSGSQYIPKSDGPSIGDRLRPALERFFQVSNPANEYFVVTFNSKVRLAQDWTSDPKAVLGTLNSLTFKRQTSMHDAVTLALDKVKTGRNSKHILILIGDGDDNNSKVGFKEVRDKLKASDVMLYCIALTIIQSPWSKNLPLRVEYIERLDELSSATGGRRFFARNPAGPEALKEVFELIPLELRAHYQLVIAPDHPGGKAKWRKIKIEAKQGTERLIARTRLWYYR